MLFLLLLKVTNQNHRDLSMIKTRNQIFTSELVRNKIFILAQRWSLYFLSNRLGFKPRRSPKNEFSRKVPRKVQRTPPPPPETQLSNRSKATKNGFVTFQENAETENPLFPVDEPVVVRIEVFENSEKMLNEYFTTLVLFYFFVLV